ncbi:MAG: nucleotidyltransferase domain-containing protein [Candidatus Pacebacteria bacterium]|nr:nucleotidyltransferase domain-containing protein [Candidatus Paceibacterota bacterium]
MDIQKYKTEHLPEIARTYGLSLVILFGSQVTGQTHKESDYDIGYTSTRPLSFEEQGILISDLMRVVGVQDERLIDLVNLRTAPPLLVHLATSNAIVLYENEPTAFATLQAYAFARYIETLPLRQANYERLQERYTMHV